MYYFLLTLIIEVWSNTYTSNIFFVSVTEETISHSSYLAEMNVLLNTMSILKLIERYCSLQAFKTIVYYPLI